MWQKETAGRESVDGPERKMVKKDGREEKRQALACLTVSLFLSSVQGIVQI